jgi:hypothetical protein
MQVPASDEALEAIVKVEFIGIAPDTDDDHCPTVWVDIDAGELLLQGWTADIQTQAECEETSPANSPVPGGETIVRIPARMVPILRRACDAIEHSDVR